MLKKVCKMCKTVNPPDQIFNDGKTFHVVKSSISGGGSRLCGPVQEVEEA